MSLDRLFARRSLGIRLELDTVFEVWRRLGQPAAGVPAVHVVGTNGKGSTSAMVDLALRRHGREVGLYTSPHLHRVGERVRIGGLAESDVLLEAAVDRVLGFEQGVNLPRPLSFFEVLTLAAWVRFAERGVEVIIAEAGMGGRYDATRICDAHVVAVTSIDLDHQMWLGDTLAAIAGEKIAVARADVPVFSVPQDPQVLEVLREHTNAIRAPFDVVTRLPQGPAGLLGAHQHSNAALALAAARVIEPAVTEADLDGVVWPGRFERIAHGGGTLIFDVAHNPAGVLALLATLEVHAPNAAIAIGCVVDKDAAAMAAAVGRSGRDWAWVDLGGFGAAGIHLDQSPCVLDALVPTLAWIDARLAGGGTVCVCGSHVLVAAVRATVLGIAAAEPGERTSI